MFKKSIYIFLIFCSVLISFLLKAEDKNKLKEYLGIISWISSQSEFSPKIIQNRDERKNLVYAIKITVQNDDNLKIGMLGDVRFN